MPRWATSTRKISAKCNCMASPGPCARTDWRVRREAVKRAGAHPPALLPRDAERATDAGAAQGGAGIRRRRLRRILLGRFARRHDEPLCGTHAADAGHAALF